VLVGQVVSILLRASRGPSATAELLIKMAVMTPILHHRTKFRKGRSNRCPYIVIFVICKMAAAAMLDFQKFKILTVGPLYVRHLAKFHQNRSNGCRDMAI